MSQKMPFFSKKALKMPGWQHCVGMWRSEIKIFLRKYPYLRRSRQVIQLWELLLSFGVDCFEVMTLKVTVNFFVKVTFELFILSPGLDFLRGRIRWDLIRFLFRVGSVAPWSSFSLWCDVFHMKRPKESIWGSFIFFVFFSFYILSMPQVIEQGLFLFEIGAIFFTVLTSNRTVCPVPIFKKFFLFPLILLALSVELAILH